MEVFSWRQQIHKKGKILIFRSLAWSFWSELGVLHPRVFSAALLSSAHIKCIRKLAKHILIRSRLYGPVEFTSKKLCLQGDLQLLIHWETGFWSLRLGESLVIAAVLRSNCIRAAPLRSGWLEFVIILSINWMLSVKKIHFALFLPGLSQNLYELCFLFILLSFVNLPLTNHLLRNWVYVERKPYVINISYNYASVLKGEMTKNLYLMEKGGDWERITRSRLWQCN